MTASTNRLGRIGENLAARHLAALGYDVIARNWRTSAHDVRGEIDIIARDGATLVFCEVKSRRRSGSAATLESVTPLKQRQIRRLAALYLTTARPSDVRFDVVAVSWPADGGAADICHVPGAF